MKQIYFIKNVYRYAVNICNFVAIYKFLLEKTTNPNKKKNFEKTTDKNILFSIFSYYEL